MYEKETFRFEMQRKFLQSVIRPILFGVLVVFSLIPIFDYIINTNKINRESNLIYRELNSRYIEINNFINDIVYEDFTFSALKHSNSVKEFYYQIYPRVNKLNSEIKFYLVNIDGKIVATNNSDIDNYNLGEKYFRNSMILEEVKTTDDIVTKRQRIKKLYKNVSYSFGKTIKTDSKHGYFIVEFPESPFGFINNLDNEFIITDKHHYLIDKSVSLSNEQFNRLTDDFLNNFSKKEKIIYHKNSSEEFDFTVISLMRLSSLVNLIVSELILLLFFIVFIALTRNKILENEKNNEVRVMKNILLALSKFYKGDYSYRIDQKVSSDFDFIITNYNVLLDEIEILIKKNVEMMELKKQSEIRQLQSQFNPHFIFNILETIKYTIEENPEEAQLMMNSLAKLLRYSISFDNDSTALLKEDLEYINYYFDLQKYRFEESLNITIDVSADLNDAIIPKLIFQPLIENSIRHGFKHVEVLKIKLIIIEKKGKLHVTVIDNGAGFDSEVLENIDNIKQGRVNYSEHVGIFNTYRRLMLHYGNEADMLIENLKEGSRVTLIMELDKYV